MQLFIEVHPISKNDRIREAIIYSINEILIETLPVKFALKEGLQIKRFGLFGNIHNKVVRFYLLHCSVKIRRSIGIPFYVFQDIAQSNMRSLCKLAHIQTVLFFLDLDALLLC